MAKADALANGRRPATDRADHGGADDGTRRTEILQTAASLIASSGLRTSLQEIADAAGILPGSLYHHFESKEAILVELIRRYQDDLNRIGQTAQARLDEPDARPVSDKIIELGSAIANCAVQHRAALQMSFYEGPERGSRADQADPAAAHRDPGGDAADAARRQVERLHQTRHRPAHAGRPDLPDHAAGRARRHAPQFPGRPGGRAAVPDHLAGVGSPAAHRFGVGPVQRLRGRQRRRRDVGRRQRRRPQRQGAPMSARWRERNSAAKATRSPPSGTSRPRPAWAPAPSIG